jgi:4-amino-4-deoxy-L-arabinose transferase-like glycosyltransferase
VSTPRPARWSTARNLILICLLAIVARSGVGVMAHGHGVMEGLADRYRQDAYALSAGYGLERPYELAPPQVRLVAVADSLAAQGERVTPAAVPAKDPALWRPSALHPPGYALYLFLIYQTLGDPLILWAKILQALFDSLACVFVFLIGRRFAGTRVGYFSAVFYALFLPIAYIVTSRVADSVIPPLYVLVFWFYIKGLDSERLRWFLLSGLVLGVMCLFRPDYVLYPLFLGFGALLFFKRPGQAVFSMSLLVLVMILVLLPYGFHNQRVMGEFKITSNAGGASVYQSLGQFPNPYGIVFKDELMVEMAHEAGFESVDDPDADRYFKQKYLTIVRENPGLILGQAVRRVPLGVAPLYRWGYTNPYYKGHSFYDYVANEGLSAYQVILRYPGEVVRAYWDRLIAGALAFVLFVSWVVLLFLERRNWRTVLILSLPYAYIFLSHLVIILGARLLVPGAFCQFIALGYLVERFLFRRPVEFWSAR